MTRARDIANLVDANGDVVAGALDNVPATDLVSDTTPQLGGALDAQGNNMTSVGSVNIGGTGGQSKFEINNAVSTAGSLTDTTINLATTGVTGRKANIGFGLAGGVANTNAATIGFDVTSGSGALQGDLFFSTRGSTADTVPTERMRIDASGYVTMPNQPAFRVNCNVSQSLATSWQTVGYGTNLTQRGSGYNTSNFIFTAPVAGWYQFSASWTATNNSDTDGTFALSINGSFSNLINSVSMPNTGPPYKGHSVSGCGYLAFGDNVRVVRYSSVATTTRTSAQYGGWFTGFFIG